MNPSLITLVLAGIAQVYISALWYRPGVFGGAWKRMSGITPEAAERAARQHTLRYAASFFAGMLIAYVLGSIGTLTAITAPGSMLMVAFLAWAGCVMPVVFMATLAEGRRYSLFFINAGHWLVSFLVIMLILIIG